MHIALIEFLKSKTVGVLRFIGHLGPWKVEIDVMTLHMNEIELEKDNRGTITAYKGHNIPSEVLDKLMPWNMA